MRYPDLSNVAYGALLSLVLLFAHAPPTLAQNSHTLPLFMSASDMERQGFVRIINRSDRAGTVTIHAIDDSGREAAPVTLSLDAKETRHFNSGDLERGNSDKELTGSTGSGEGHWRLKLETDLDIEPLAYIRTPADGFLTSIHDVAQGESMRWHVPIFNPASNPNQKSLLRLINTSGVDTEVVIEGLDDRGDPAPGGDLRVSLPADAARLYSAQELETGHSESDFEGGLGDGTGKWQLFVSANRPIQAMSLMSTPTGHITNLSATKDDDIIRGGTGSDEIWGGEGDDILNPGHNDLGHDIVHGSAGDDRIIYTDSGTSAYQELTYSELSSGRIVATIDGSTNLAMVDKGSAGTDTIVDIANPMNAAVVRPFGGFGLYGTPFGDTYHLTVDNQWMQVGGGAGNDTFNLQISGYGGVAIDYKDARNGIRVDLGADTVDDDGFGGRDTIVVNSGYAPVILGSEFSDVMVGDGNNNAFMGRQGDDDIDGGGGTDGLNFSYLAGSPGYSVSVDNLNVDLEAGTATGTWNGGAFSYRISRIENVRGHMGNDIIRGDSGSNRIRGLGGNDTLRGEAGDDRLEGGEGDDILNPGHNDLGHDIVHGSAGDDRIIYTDSGTSAYQELTYSELSSGRIVATIDGSTNLAMVDKGSAGTDTIVDIANPMNAAVVRPFGGFGLYGTPFGDTYHLTVDNQWMQVGGGAGNDTFNLQISGYGGVAIDYKDARNGIRVDLGADTVDDDGFGGRDTIVVNSGYAPVILGSEFSDVMVGDGNNNAFMGRQGDDDIDGGGGTDGLNFSYLAGSPGYSVSVDNLNVDLEAGTATGTWNGGAFSYRISRIENVRGHMGNDIIRGDSGSNRIRGLGGNDTLRGEAGDDRLEGGEGDDTFVFGLRHGNDTIADFTDGEDRMDFNELNLSSHSDVTSATTSRSDGSVHIDLSRFGGGTIILLNFDIADLNASDILL